MKQEIYMKSTEFKPKDNKVLVKPEELKSEQITESGIVLKMNNRSVVERPSSGRVIDIGNGVTDVDVGSIVIWPAQDGIDLKFDDGDFLLLRHESIIGSKKE